MEMRRYLIAILFVALMLVPEIGFALSDDTSPLHTKMASDITLRIDFGNGTIQEYMNLSGNNVLDVTNSATTVEVEWYGDLAYVTAISGVHENASENLFWQYWVNGELGGTAANKYIVQDGDIILWKLPAQTDDIGGEVLNDISLFVGIGVVSIMAIALICALRVRRGNE